MGRVLFHRMRDGACDDDRGEKIEFGLVVSSRELRDLWLWRRNHSSYEVLQLSSHSALDLVSRIPTSAR